MNLVESGGAWRNRVARPADAAGAPPAAAPASQGEVKAALKALPLVELHRAWFAPKATRAGFGDEVNTSCFNHIAHPNGDENPQLGINTAKNTYYCHACQVTGDIIDLGAVRMGLADGNYRCPDSAVDTVIRALGSELLGAVAWIDSSGTSRFTLPHAAPAPNGVNGFTPIPLTVVPEPEKDPQNPPKEDEKAPLEEDFEWKMPTFPWEKVLDKHGFAMKYLRYATKDDECVEEYHLYNALLCLGMVAGPRIGLEDEPPVRANVFLCDVGPTGSGKSTAAGLAYRLLREVAPWNGEAGTGVRLSPEIASGEALVDFLSPVHKPPVPPGSPAAAPVTHTDVRAVLDYDELSAVMARASRQSATLDSTMMRLYGCPPEVGILSRTAGERTATRPYVSLLTGAQPARLAELIQRGQVASGFANRIIYVFGHRKPGIAIRSRRADPVGLADALRRVESFAATFANMGDGLITWSPEARTEFKKFHSEHVEPLRESGSDIMARVGVSLKKHVLWMCLDSCSPQVTKPILARALAFWPYIVASYETMERNLDQNLADQADIRLDNEESEKVVAAVAARFAETGVWPTKNEVRMRGLSRRQWTVEKVNRKFKELVAAGILIEIPPVAGALGRPQVRYMVP